MAVQIPHGNGQFGFLKGKGAMGRPIVKYRGNVPCMSCTKTAELFEIAFGMLSGMGTGMHISRYSAHWRHVANTIEPSVCGGDAAFCQIT